MFFAKVIYIDLKKIIPTEQNPGCVGVSYESQTPAIRPVEPSPRLISRECPNAHNSAPDRTLRPEHDRLQCNADEDQKRICNQTRPSNGEMQIKLQ